MNTPPLFLGDSAANQQRAIVVQLVRGDGIDIVDAKNRVVGRVEHIPTQVQAAAAAGWGVGGMAADVTREHFRVKCSLCRWKTIWRPEGHRWAPTTFLRKHQDASSTCRPSQVRRWMTTLEEMERASLVAAFPDWLERSRTYDLEMCRAELARARAASDIDTPTPMRR